MNVFEISAFLIGLSWKRRWQVSHSYAIVLFSIIVQGLMVKPLVEFLMSREPKREADR